MYVSVPHMTVTMCVYEHCVLVPAVVIVSTVSLCWQYCLRVLSVAYGNSNAMYVCMYVLYYYYYQYSFFAQLVIQNL